MVSSIEERAALNLRYERDFLGNDLSENMVRRAYIRGATEQKIIDAEWLRSQMKTLYDDEWYDPDIEYWVNEFKKNNEVINMKSNELMIGDWVTFEDEPLKVQHIYNNGYDDVVAEIVEEFLDEDGVICEGIKDVPLVNCSPIPLTPEILEKNGWWYDGDDMWQHEEVGFYIEKLNERFRCYDITDIKLDSVHQLQQTLRLCGLDKLADNFKV